MEGVNLSSLEHMGAHIVPYFVTSFWFTYFTYVFCLPELFLFRTVSPGYLNILFLLHKQDVYIDIYAPFALQ